MKFTFKVGNEEHHEVQFTHDLFWGRLGFNVDGMSIPTEGMPLFSIHLDTVRTIVIGEKEKHEVRVQLVRPLMLAGFRSDWKYKIFIDGHESRTFNGSNLE